MARRARCPAARRKRLNFHGMQDPAAFNIAHEKPEKARGSDKGKRSAAVYRKGSHSI